ncbi:MAG: CoA pyrophosphatase [Pseudomonadota bacterium]
MADPLLVALARAAAAPRRDTSDFDLNPDISQPRGPSLRPAAVLVPLEESDAGWRLWLTRRSDALRHHPGQISFPGGKQDPSDTTLVDTALREAEEELGLRRAQVEVLGSLAPHKTVTSFAVTPIIGVIRGDFVPVIDRNEVAEAFPVPTRHVLDIAHFRVEGRQWQGTTRHYYTVPYGPHYIWGATARILRALAEEVRDAA